MRAIALAVFNSFVRMPLRGHLLSITEGLWGLAALELFASGYRGWGGTAMVLTMLLCYADGAGGWSVRKEED